jgi:hypothetical protein
MTASNRYNTLVLGAAGDGMSFFAGDALAQVMAAGRPVVTIDAGTPTAKVMQALWDQLTPDQQLSMNRGTLVNPFALAARDGLDGLTPQRPLGLQRFDKSTKTSGGEGLGRGKHA